MADESRYNILMFLSNETKGLEKECVIRKSLLPNKDYFRDFRKLVLTELEKLIFGDV